MVVKWYLQKDKKDSGNEMVKFFFLSFCMTALLALLKSWVNTSPITMLRPALP
jgi:hypothetical protein